MTTTQTELVATNCVILLDNAANQLKDISGSLNSVEIAPENGVAEWHTFGTQWKQRRVIHKDATVTIRGVYSSNATEVAQLVENWFFSGNDSPRTLMIYIPDTQPGAYTYSGEFVLSNYTISPDAEADDVIRIEIELLPDNVITRATNAT